MFRYLTAALPRTVLAGGVPLIAGLLWLLDRWPWITWPAAGIGAGLLGAVAARLFDEPTAAIVDATPRPLWWRTAARLAPAALLAAAWWFAVPLVDLQGAGRTSFVQLEGVTTVLLAAALTTWLRHRGQAVPGRAVAAALLLIPTALALRNPLHPWLPLYPYGPWGSWQTATTLWTALATASATLLVTALACHRTEHGARCR